MRIFRAFPQPESLEAVDAGSGGGGTPSGGVAPSGGGVAPGAAGGGVASAPVSLSDDTVVTLGGKTAPWKEHQQGFVPRSDFDAERGRFTTYQNNLKILANNLKNNPAFQKQAQPQQRQDPLAHIRTMPIVDGATLAQMAESGFGQMAQTIKAIQDQNQQLTKKLSALEGGVGSMRERNAQGDFSKRVDGVITALGPGFDPKNETLRTLAEDVYHSYDNWKDDAEFASFFKKRVEGMRKLVREMDQNELKAAKERRFVRPGGNGQPGGAPKFDHRNAAKQAADMLFGPSNART